MAALDDHLPYALRQFETDVLIPIHVFGIDVSFTTGSQAKITTLALLAAYLIYAGRTPALVPGRLQASAEMAYAFVANTVTKVAGPEAKSSIPFVFTMFVFVLFGTLLGLTPIKETFTSHLVVTLTLALIVFAYVNTLGIRKQGAGFFRMFLPSGLPLFVIPIFLIVEIVSYLFRPITLGFRIFANIIAGHIMLKLFADFCGMLVTALGPLGIVASVFPVMIMVILYGFEILIVFIQSYIFMLLTAMYLRDAMHAHK